MPSNKILIPKGYLSWSQLSLFERSPKEYKRIYILGEEQRTSRAMEYGSKLADVLENGDDGEDVLISSLYSLLPKYKTMEKKIEAETGGIKILGKLDTYCPKTHNFREYKTGKIPWTQRKVDNHGQITFYAMLIFLAYKKIPKDIELIWAETEYIDGEIQATGRIKTFKTKRTLIDIMKFMARVGKVAKQINEIYKKSIKDIF